MEYTAYPGIYFNVEEAMRVTRAVVGEQPLSADLFAGLRRAMQLGSMTKIQPLPEYDSK